MIALKMSLALYQVGIGILRPNSILLAYPTHWRKQSRAENNNFVHLIRSIIASDKVAMILKADQIEHPFPSLRATPFDAKSTIDVYCRQGRAESRLVPFL